MKFSVYLISLISVLIIPKTYSQNTSTKAVPGCSGCVYYGAIPEYCNGTAVPAADLPPECTSFLFLEIYVDENFTVTFAFDDSDNDAYIKDLLTVPKPTFLYLNHGGVDGLMTAIQNNAENAKTEMENLKAFIEPYNTIAGFVIVHVVPGPDCNDTAAYTANFQAYVEELRTCFPTYSIGIEIGGINLVDFQNQDSPPGWLDFTVLDPCIDFYNVYAPDINDCTDDLKVGGTTPLSGDAPYTLEIISGFILQLQIPTEKTYYVLAPGPSVVNVTDSCEKTNTKFCASNTTDIYCSDNTQSYFDKGAFTTQSGAGFIAMNVDLRDDADGSCQCGCKYAAFHAMLAGAKGDPVPSPCPLLDKS